MPAKYDGDATAAILTSGPNGHGNHAFIDGVAKSDARIEAVGHDVSEAVVDIKLNLDIAVWEKLDELGFSDDQVATALESEDPISAVVALASAQSPNHEHCPLAP